MINHLELMRIFCAAAEAESFRAAARRLGISPQTVTRAIQDLETHFGELLFHRSTRQTRVTAFGEALAQRGRGFLEQFDELFQDAHVRQESEIPTQVRVTMTRSLGRICVLPGLLNMARENPHIVLDIRLTDQIANVVDEQIDIGVRIGFMRDNRFVARAVRQTRFVVVGAADLVARRGRPTRVEELAGLPTTALVDANTGKNWPWYFSEGRQWTPAAPSLVTDDPDAECQAVLAGMGYGQLPHFLAAPHLESGALVEVLQEDAPAPWDIFVYRPQRGPVPPRIREVFDSIVEELSAL